MGEFARSPKQPAERNKLFSGNVQRCFSLLLLVLSPTYLPKFQPPNFKIYNQGLLIVEQKIKYPVSLLLRGFQVASYLRGKVRGTFVLALIKSSHSAITLTYLRGVAQPVARLCSPPLCSITEAEVIQPMKGKLFRGFDSHPLRPLNFIILSPMEPRVVDFLVGYSIRLLMVPAYQPRILKA